MGDANRKWAKLNAEVDELREYKKMYLEAEAEIDRLKLIEHAARSYCERYVLDEADDEENCISPQQHILAKSLCGLLFKKATTTL